MMEKKKLIRNLFTKFFKDKKPFPLMLISIIKLKDRGEEITPATVRNEARKIVRASDHIFNWGISEEDITLRLTSDILEELVSIGVLEPVGDVSDKLERKYRFASRKNPVENELIETEVLRGLGLILARRCC